MNINDKLINLIATKANETEIECRFLKKGLGIYKLFGAIPIMKFREKEPIWGANVGRIDYSILHFHLKGEPCCHNYYPLCKYLRGLRSINGSNGSDGPTVLDPNLRDLACEVYRRASVKLVTYPDVWYNDYDIQLYGTVPENSLRCEYTVRLIPDIVKAMMNEVCDELEYMPPNNLLLLGGTKYQQGKQSFELNHLMK